jgi:alpha-N-arabinofuranosidase
MISTPRYGDLPAVESNVTREPDTGIVTVFAVNRSVADAIPLRVELKGDRPYGLALTSRLHEDDFSAGNSADEPNRVTPSPIDDASFDGNVLDSILPPVSWNVYRLAPKF